MKDVIVTGGRDYSDKAKVYSILELFDIGLLIQGGASGADALAVNYGHKNGIHINTVHANWTKYGRAAGPKRNIEMLEKYPNAVVVAFPGGNGTANCKAEAIKRGMIVLQVY